MVYDEINTAIKHLPKWAEIRHADGGKLSQYPGRLLSYTEPLGLVLIIVPWNYPVQLVFSPLTAAIAAGNCVVIKPSELAPKTQQVVKTIIEETFDSIYISIFTGGAEVSKELLQEDFDHIFFVGSPRVGKEIMKAAAEHLTSVTLELGGKSPCIVEDTADLKVAAKRIIWGKCLNCGQTCIAPDYVLVDRNRKEELLRYMKQYLEEFYPGDIFENPDYPRIVNEQQLDRLLGYLDDGRIVYGGHHRSGKTEAGTDHSGSGGSGKQHCHERRDFWPHFTGDPVRSSGKSHLLYSESSQTADSVFVHSRSQRGAAGDASGILRRRLHQ